MKIVVKLTRLGTPEYAAKFARAIAGLPDDGHSVAIVHGFRGERVDLSAPGNVRANMLSAAEIAEIESDNRNLVAALGRAGVPALGLSTADGGMCKVRKCHVTCSRGVELATMDSRWIQIICANGGVPVLSNVALASWGELCLLDSDEVAADCAKAWHADVLIYLTSVEGVRNADGSTIRWLDIRNVDVLRARAEITDDMLGKLTACRRALESGVGRVRILPLSHVDSLPLFFSSRIDVGTEVVGLSGASETVLKHTAGTH
jgi:acetylglutamate kinase